MNPRLFSPMKLRDLQLRNRIAVSPMCQYSAIEGVPNDWHLVHLGSRAVGGAGVVMCEATAVSPEGRISPEDTGLWNDVQTKAFVRICDFIKSQSSIPAIQLAHAGRKASTRKPWEPGQKSLNSSEGGWPPLGPSPVAFEGGYPAPQEMTKKDMEKVLEDFSRATMNAIQAGFQIVEVHMAHGYLFHEFLSPLSNCRQDEYGGSLENRMRFPLEVTQLVRKLWPQEWPVFVRISATDWIEGGWTLEDSVQLCHKLKDLGIDLIDCSSGGTSPSAKIAEGPGYQVPFAAEIRKSVQIATGAVGLITGASQAEDILRNHQADLIFIGREFLRDPYWPLHAAKTLGGNISWPNQYLRAKS